MKSLDIPEVLKSHAFMDKRAEELSVEDFINFTKEWKLQKLIKIFLYQTLQVLLVNREFSLLIPLISLFVIRNIAVFENYF